MNIFDATNRPPWVPVPGQLGIVPDSPAAVEDARAAAREELDRLDLAALGYRTSALENLRQQATAHRAAGEELDQAVGEARAAGATWQQIADVTGMRRQSAWARWGKVPDDFLPGAREDGSETGLS